ncbi:oligosaccharide flippase family protein, partial [Escherichia sp. 93.1518]|uniref:oligosaccharide flippase family protein n=3 Tax=Escherichia TaxID=561 RepID=UPI0016029BFD
IYNSKGKIDDAYLNTLKIAGIVVFPILLGIGLISKPLVSVLLGKEWQFTSDILFLLCIAFMIYPIHAININILQVHGRSDLFLRLEVLKKILMTIILVITTQININAMVIGLVLHSYLSWFLNGLFSQKVSTITIGMQLKNLLPIWCLCLISGLSSNYFINEMKLEPLLNIAFTVLLNAFIYIMLIRIMYK